MDYKAVELKDIDKRLRKLVDRGEDAARQKNYSYAMEMFRELLKKEPGALEVRQRLRDLQYQRLEGNVSAMHQMWANILSIPFWLWSMALLKGEDEKVIKAADNAEQMLAVDCTAFMPIMMLDRAIYELDLPQASVQILEWGIQFHPKSTFLLSRLAEAYMNAGMGTKCLAVYKKLQQLNPKDKRWAEAVKDATAEAAMTAGGWTKVARGEGDFREIIRDTGQAKRLEQAGRTVKSEEGLRDILAGALEEVETSDTYDKRFQIAELYAELKEYDNAIIWYEKAIEASEINDPAVQQALINVRIRKFDSDVKALQEQLADETLDDATREDLQQQLAAVRQDKADTLLEALRNRVRKNPNLHQERLELAKMLLEQGEPDEALGHLQKLQSHPNLGVQASFFLGNCFAMKKVYDLAIEQYQKVREQIQNMTPLKKEATYNLGQVHEKNGNAEEAAACFKAIYAEDAEYRDVAKIIENLYQR